MANQNPHLWRTRDAADYGQTSTRTIRNMMKDGRLRCIRIGRAVRFNPETVRQAFDALETKGGAN